MRKLLITTLLMAIFLFNFNMSYSQEHFIIEDGYAYFINHPKSKGVNFKVRVPEGWKVQDGIREDIVGKIICDDGVFMIMVLELPTFISREESKDVYESDEYENSILNEYNRRYLNPKIISSSIDYIDGYPVELIKVSYDMSIPWENKTQPYITRNWFLMCEDKIIMLLCTNHKKNDKYFNIQSCNIAYSFVFLEDGYVPNYY